MNTLYVIGGLSLIASLALWLAVREARRGGRAEEKAEEATRAVQNAEHVAAVVADAPRDADELNRRVLDGTWKL